METLNTVIADVKVLVFLRTSEEAVSNVADIFSFSDPIAVLTNITNAFDNTTNTQVITLEGTGFGTDTSAIEFYIDGTK